MPAVSPQRRPETAPPCTCRRRWRPRWPPRRALSSSARMRPASPGASRRRPPSLRARDVRADNVSTGRAAGDDRRVDRRAGERPRRPGAELGGVLVLRASGRSRASGVRSVGAVQREDVRVQLQLRPVRAQAGRQGLQRRHAGRAAADDRQRVRQHQPGAEVGEQPAAAKLQGLLDRDRPLPHQQHARHRRALGHRAAGVRAAEDQRGLRADARQVGRGSRARSSSCRSCRRSPCATASG